MCHGLHATGKLVLICRASIASDRLVSLVPGTVRREQLSLVPQEWWDADRLLELYRESSGGVFILSGWEANESATSQRT